MVAQEGLTVEDNAKLHPEKLEALNEKRLDAQHEGIKFLVEVIDHRVPISFFVEKPKYREYKTEMG